MTRWLSILLAVFLGGFPGAKSHAYTPVANGAHTGDLYDAQNRLIATGRGINLSYDAEGNRVSKTVSGSTTHYLVDDQNPSGYPQVIAEYGSVSNVPSVTYCWGLSLIAEQPKYSNPLYYGYDGQGNVRMLLNTSGGVADSYDYDGYGDLLASSGSDGNEYRYTGQQWDSDLGMYYLRARYYSPNLGRFWTMDISEGDQEEPLSLHKYLYCEANPVNGSDPSGHMDDIATFSVSMNLMVGLGGLTAAAVVGAQMHAAATVTESVWDFVGQAIVADAETYNARIDEMQMEQAMSTLQSMGKPLKSLIEQAKQIAKKTKVVPMPRSVIQEVADHVASAMGSKGMPALLERVDAADAEKNRRIALAGKGWAGLGKSWDEYPFASGNPFGIAPDVVPVPTWENSMQGGIISGCYKLENINVGTPYVVVVIP